MNKLPLTLLLLAVLALSGCGTLFTVVDSFDANGLAARRGVDRTVRPLALSGARFDLLSVGTRPAMTPLLLLDLPFSLLLDALLLPVTLPQSAACVIERAGSTEGATVELDGGPTMDPTPDTPRPTPERPREYEPKFRLGC